MKQYKLKLTAITPLHIGTGEDYDPTNYVIDSGYLYEFDEYKFFERLPSNMKDRFTEVAKNGAESLFEIHSLIKKHKKQAVESAILKVEVTKGIDKDYENKVGRAVQNEGGRRVQKTKVFNRFQIARTIRETNSKKVYIPGSSLKGALSTAYQEGIYKQSPSKWKEYFEKPLNNIFKNFLVSDTKVIKADAKIGYILNKERFEDEPLGPSNKMEVIKDGSIFETTISFRGYEAPQMVDFNFLKEWCDKHYLALFRQSFEPYTMFKGQKVDDYTNEYYPDDFYKKYKNFTPKENQFLIRVGKHSGARAVTIDGMREIRVKVSGGGPRRKPNKWETLDQETTTWMFGERERDEANLLPMGWVLCEIEELKDGL